VMSTGVPKMVIVLNNASTPHEDCSRSGVTTPDA
jgi:hypothetical protein